MDDIETLTARLAHAQRRLYDLDAAFTRARHGSEAATPGGLVGYDRAILSGTRRSPSPRADARRYNAYDREAAAARALEEQRRQVAVMQRSLEQARREAPVAFTGEELRSATHVRSPHGWHTVVRVNAKTVTVATGYSWTDRIAHTDIREVRTIA